MDGEDILKGILLGIILIVCIGLIGTCTGIIHFGARQAEKVFDHTYDVDTAFTNYDWFHDTYNDILATRDKIRDAYDMSVKPGLSEDMRSMYQVNYSGLCNFIRSMVSEYNSKSSQWEKVIFKDKKLPYKLKVTIKDGDCTVIEQETE